MMNADEDVIKNLLFRLLYGILCCAVYNCIFRLCSHLKPMPVRVEDNMLLAQKKMNRELGCGRREEDGCWEQLSYQTTNS